MTSAEEALPAAQQLIAEMARLADRLYAPSVQELRDDLGKLETDSLTDTFYIDVAVKGELTPAVTATQQEVTEQVQTAGSHLTALHGELDIALGRVHADFLTTETERLLDETQARIEHELRDLIDRALEQVTDVIRDTSRKLTEASDDTARERQLVEPMVRQLEPLIGPLRQVTDHVMDMARGLGL